MTTLSTRHAAGLVMFAALAACALPACGPPDEARFDATFDAQVDCIADHFPFEPTLFAATRTSGGLLLRMQDSSRARTRANGFYVAIQGDQAGAATGAPCPDVDALAGQTVDVGPEACAQAYFRFNGDCAREFTSPQVVGTVAFSEVGLDRGDRVAGTVSGALVDVVVSNTSGVPKLHLTPIGTVDGTFDFGVSVGPPYQIYATPPGPVSRP